MKFNTNPVRGTVDYMPQEMEIRSYAEQIILKTYKENGFMQIKTPILENLDLLTNGDSGDNQKLMFKTIKRGAQLDLTKPNLKEEDIAEEGLRYDLTVPLVRFFCNNMSKLPIPFKSIQIDEAFRAERPQKGRVRQFTQCDIDILGDSSPLCEIELLNTYMQAYSRLGFTNIKIKVNDRRVLNQIIEMSGFDKNDIVDVCVSLDKLDKIGVDGVKNELIQKGYLSTNCEKLVKILVEIQNSKTNAESFKKLAELGIDKNVVDSLKLIIETADKFKIKGFEIVFDVSIIRGQGYYTGTVFEVYDADFGRALGGGGRYDKMIEKFTGVPTPAVGCSIGLYTTVMLMIERNAAMKNNKIALIYNKNDSFENVILAKSNLIKNGFEVSVFAFPKNFNNFVERLKANGINKLIKMSNLEKIIDL